MNHRGARAAKASTMLSATANKRRAREERCLDLVGPGPPCTSERRPMFRAPQVSEVKCININQVSDQGDSMDTLNLTDR